MLFLKRISLLCENNCTEAFSLLNATSFSLLSFQLRANGPAVVPYLAAWCWARVAELLPHPGTLARHRNCPCVQRLEFPSSQGREKLTVRRTAAAPRLPLEACFSFLLSRNQIAELPSTENASRAVW